MAIYADIHGDSLERRCQATLGSQKWQFFSAFGVYVVGSFREALEIRPTFLQVLFSPSLSIH